jgi:GNAT superfamily N-acetyltransferase
MYIESVDIYLLGDYAKHLKGLTDQDKHSRFGSRVTDFAIDQLMLRIAYSPDNHKLWGAYNLEDEIIGWGHLASDGKAWELAVSVDEEYQGNGIGSLLIQEMLEWAKFHHVEEVYMHCIEDNKTIQHLAAKHGLKTRERGYGERTAAIEVPEPSLLETNTQLLKEHAAIMADYRDLRKRLTDLWFGQLTNTH